MKSVLNSERQKRDIRIYLEATSALSPVPLDQRGGWDSRTGSREDQNIDSLQRGWQQKFFHW
jgi:hypothetical protein